MAASVPCAQRKAEVEGVIKAKKKKGKANKRRKEGLNLGPLGEYSFEIVSFR